MFPNVSVGGQTQFSWQTQPISVYSQEDFEHQMPRPFARMKEFVLERLFVGLTIVACFAVVGYLEFWFWRNSRRSDRKLQQ